MGAGRCMIIFIKQVINSPLPHLGRTHFSRGYYDHIMHVWALMCAFGEPCLGIKKSLDRRIIIFITITEPSMVSHPSLRKGNAEKKRPFPEMCRLKSLTMSEYVHILKTKIYPTRFRFTDYAFSM